MNLAKRTNAAFVFIKPHACNDKVCHQIASVGECFTFTGLEAPT